jgi:signal transduction histidine kinase
VVAVSTGHLVSFDEFIERMQRGGALAAALGHRATLSELSRIRHDINNALTSALAETQFMRMDAPAVGELAEGLKVVESQLQRVRELTSELGAFRVRLQ